MRFRGSHSSFLTPHSSLLTSLTVLSAKTAKRQCGVLELPLERLAAWPALAELWECIAMLFVATLAYAFSFPPCVGLGCIYGGHLRCGESSFRLITGADAAASAGAGAVSRRCCQKQHRSRRQRLRRESRVSISSSADDSADDTAEAWRPVPHRPFYWLVERNKRHSAMMAMRDIAALDEAALSGVDDGQHHDQQQEERKRVATLWSAQEDELRDDPFEELEGDRPRHPCVVHNHLSAPTPYSEGWEWQKQVNRDNDIIYSSTARFAKTLNFFNFVRPCLNGEK